MNKTATAAYSRQAWTSLIAVSLFFCYEFMQLSIFNAIGDEIMHAFHLNAKQLGNLSAYYFYANALLLIPAGIMLDKFSTKSLVLLNTLLCSIATLVFACTTNYWIAATTRFLVGCGAAFCFISCIRIASRWFPPQKMAIATGVISMVGMLGGMLTQMPCVALNNILGWRYTILGDAALGVVIMLAIWRYVEDYPPQHQHQPPCKLAIWSTVTTALTNHHNLIAGLYASLLNFAVVLLGALWGIQYLATNHFLSPIKASYATMMYFAGMIIGGIMYGYISDRYACRKIPMIIGPLVSLCIVLYLMLSAPLSLLTLVLLCCSLGMSISSQLLTYPTVVELNPATITATASSVVSLLLVSGAFIIQPLFGVLMHHHYQTHRAIMTSSYNLIQYSATDIKFAMWLLPISFVVATVIALFIPETHSGAKDSGD